MRISITKAIVLTVIFMALSSVVWAGGDKDCPYGHQHQGSCQGPPGADGEDGQDGTDGIDGRDGKDGADGIDGRDGRDGIDGLNGLDGIVDYTTINRNLNNETARWRHWLAAQSAIQIHLPQDSSQRLTLSGSTVDGTGGVGLGYAYKFDRDDNLAISAGIGSSGDEQVGVLAVGFEFGGSRSQVVNDFESRYDSEMDSLRRQVDILTDMVERQDDICREANNRVHEVCQRSK